MSLSLTIRTLGAGVLLASAAWGVEPGKSNASFTFGPGEMKGVAKFAWEDIDSVLEIDLDRNGALEASEVESAERFLEEYGSTLYHISQPGGEPPVTRVESRYDPDLGGIKLAFEVELATDAEADSVSIDFAGHTDFAVGHLQALELQNRDGERVWRREVGNGNARPLFPTFSSLPKASTMTRQDPKAEADRSVPVNFQESSGAARSAWWRWEVILPWMGIALMGGVWLIRRIGAFRSTFP